MARALGLPAALPVKFLATFDAPHYGMHLNLDMQQSMWERQSAARITSETNLDSCAAAQILRGQDRITIGDRHIALPVEIAFAGAFLNAPRWPRTRIDSTQHCLSAMLKYGALRKGGGCRRVTAAR